MDKIANLSLKTMKDKIQSGSIYKRMKKTCQSRMLWPEKLSLKIEKEKNAHQNKPKMKEFTASGSGYQEMLKGSFRLKWKKTRWQLEAIQSNKELW